MGIRKSARSAWMGLALGLLAGSVEAADAARQVSTAPTTPTAMDAKEPIAREEAQKVAAERSVKIMRGDSIAPLMVRVESEEAKARRQQHSVEVKAVRAMTQKMDEDYVTAVRERENARREAQKAKKTSLYVPPEAKAGSR